MVFGGAGNHHHLRGLVCIGNFYSPSSLPTSSPARPPRVVCHVRFIHAKMHVFLVLRRVSSEVKHSRHIALRIPIQIIRSALLGNSARPQPTPCSPYGVQETDSGDRTCDPASICRVQSKTNKSPIETYASSLLLLRTTGVLQVQYGEGSSYAFLQAGLPLE